MDERIEELERENLLRNIAKQQSVIDDMQRRDRIRSREWWLAIVGMVGCTLILVLAAFWSK